MCAIADTCLEVDDGTVQAECLLLGEDATQSALGIKAMMEQTVRTFRQRRLTQAAAEFRALTAAMRSKWAALPERPEERRTLLAAIFQKQPQMERAFLTIQHREFTALSDQDVESCLRQLAALGVSADSEDGDGG
jgi:2-methylcitrate dehydratase PrpD